MVTEKRKICVTGAGGQTGRHVLRALAPFSEQYSICAAVHAKEQSEQEQRVKEACPQACSCALDADDFDSCVEAFKGASDLFIVPSSSEAKVRHALTYLRAAKKAGVPFVCVLSMAGCDRRDYLWADQFWTVEEEVKRLGLKGWCILRSAFYIQNLLLYAQQYAQGHVPLPMGGAKFAPVDVHDVGEAAAAVLKDCKPHTGKTYTVTGPELLSGKEIAGILTEFMGGQGQQGKLEWRDIPLQDARSILTNAGVPQSEVQGLVEFYRMARERDEPIDAVSSDFKNLTGHDATRMRDWLARNQERIMSLIAHHQGQSTGSQPSTQPVSSHPQSQQQSQTYQA